MTRSSLLALVVVGACQHPGPVPVPVPPAPTVAMHTFGVTVRGLGGAPLVAAVGAFTADDGSVGACTNAGGYLECTSTTSVDTHGGWLVVSADTFEPVTAREPLDGNLGEVALHLAHRVGLERGWLRRVGARVITEDGTTWQGRGLSSFRLLERFCNGENIDRVLDQAIIGHRNFLRVFGMYAGGIGTFTLARDNPGRWSDCVRALGATIAARQLRWELTVFADAQNIFHDEQPQKAFFYGVAVPALADQWNALGELVNEYNTNGVYPPDFEKPPTRTLWANGVKQECDEYDPVACMGADYSPVWDYITHHPARSDDWMRKIECRPITDARGAPCMEDEPMGFSSVVTRGGRDNHPDHFGWFGGLCALWATMGCTFHSDNGILAEAPGDDEVAAMLAMDQGQSFAPVDAPFAAYQRGNNCGDCDGIGNMPLEQHDLSEGSAPWERPGERGTLRTACRQPDGSEYCVAVAPGPAWVATPRAGWRIDAQSGPRGAFVHLVH